MAHATQSYWQASDYAAYRPHYPETLFQHLFDLSGGSNEKVVWDCATGNGQAAVGLVPYFRRIIATDVNASQISNAIQHPQIEYRLTNAEESKLDNESIDLITVGQALHWFNFPLFFLEVRRVLKPNTGLLAVWCYDLFNVPDSDDADHTSLRNAIHAFHDLVESYWPPERIYVQQSYQTIDFPTFLEELPKPTQFEMTLNWNYEHTIGYVMTWSATTRYINDHGQERVDQAVQAIRSAWGDPHIIKRIEWPLTVRIFRNGVPN